MAVVSRLVLDNKAFWLSAVATLVFYGPSLAANSANAGFLFTGDVNGFYLPEMAKTQSLISNFNFTALDFSTFNGSSDYFLAANFYACYPPLILYSLLTSTQNTTWMQLGHFLVLLISLNAFLSCYFTVKLFSHFFSFSFGTAAVVAVVFSIAGPNVYGQPEFIFSVLITPWAAYSALAYAATPTFRQLAASSVPVVLGLLGGYVPLAMASLALSAALVSVQITLIDEGSTSTEARWRKLVAAAMPYIFAGAIVSPYWYALHAYLLETPAAIRGLSLFQRAPTRGTAAKRAATHFEPDASTREICSF